MNAVTTFTKLVYQSVRMSLFKDVTTFVSNRRPDRFLFPNSPDVANCQHAF